MRRAKIPIVILLLAILLLTISCDFNRITSSQLLSSVSDSQFNSASQSSSENGPQRNYGLRVHPKYKDIRFHYGIDLGGEDYEGDEIIASASGTVTAMKSNIADAGNYTEIKHSIFGVTFKSRYLHLQSFRRGLKVGDSIKSGTIIGHMGKSGTSDIHLHYEVIIESDSTFFKGFLVKKPYTKSYYFNPLLLNYK
ncbi:MAG: M23 family metallopeptidase [Saccharofermentanales bacterium]